MPRITEELVRRRAEHNNCEITTLEELSLHQQDIERIEHLDRWCRGLKILYLQNNLIPRIENVSRLKQLTYLNLALNNVETIENLEGCEFLQKLDLTVNFVGDLLSVERLRENHHLEELYLTGNPCTDYKGYREFVVATLPRLKTLDGRNITKSERILAQQRLKELHKLITEQQEVYQEKREREKTEYAEKKTKRKKDKDGSAGEMTSDKPGFNKRWYTDPNSHLGGSGKTSTQGGSDRGGSEDEEEEEDFTDESIPYTPESRVETSRYIAEKRKANGKEPDGPEVTKRVRRLEKDGKMLNVNEGRYDFHLGEDEDSGCYRLEVDCPRFMDTSFMECDIQPTYVRITIKGKILQLVLPEEVSPDRSTAQRSHTTGKLLLTMPKVKPIIKSAKSAVPMTSTTLGVTKHKAVVGTGTNNKLKQEVKHSTCVSKTTEGGLLEVDPSLKSKTAKLASIVKLTGDVDTVSHHERTSELATKKEPPPTLMKEGPAYLSDFVDDPDVPPLI